MLHIFDLFVLVTCLQYNNWFTFSEYEEPVTIRSCRPIHAKELTMVSTLLLLYFRTMSPIHNYNGYLCYIFVHSFLFNVNLLLWEVFNSHFIMGCDRELYYVAF